MSNLAEALRSHAASRLAALRGRRLAALLVLGAALAWAVVRGALSFFCVVPGHEGLHGSLVVGVGGERDGG